MIEYESVQLVTRKNDRSLDDPALDDAAEKTEIFETSDIVSAVQSGPARRHVLVRMDPGDAGNVWAPTETVSSVGRSARCSLRLDAEGVSRHHCDIRRIKTGFVIEDAGSANGTLVNGSRVARHLLVDGDLVQVGPRVLLRYSVTDAHQEQLMRQLYDASVRDSLTGAFKREHLMVRLRAELSHARRHGGDLSVLMLDIDHFKQVNDTHGHPAGDAVLVALVQGMTTIVRTEDLLARYGGEEFVILLPGQSLAGAHRVGERLRDAALTAPVRVGKKKIHYTLSVGCASLACSTEQTPEDLVSVADRRLYAAKRAGRNRVVSAG